MLFRGCNSCTYCTSGNYHQCPIEGMHTAIGIFHNGGWAQSVSYTHLDVYKRQEN